MCAYTQFGGYEYWTEWNQFLTLFPSVYVIDEKGLVDLQSKQSSSFPFDLVTITIKRDNLEGIDESGRNETMNAYIFPTKCMITSSTIMAQWKSFEPPFI